MTVGFVYRLPRPLSEEKHSRKLYEYVINKSAANLSNQLITNIVFRLSVLLYDKLSTNDNGLKYAIIMSSLASRNKYTFKVQMHISTAFCVVFVPKITFYLTIFASSRLLD